MKNKSDTTQSSSKSLHWAIAIFLCGLILTALAAQAFSKHKLAQGQAAYEERFEHLSLAVEDQYADALNGVNSAVALDASLAQTSAEQFRDYVKALALAADFNAVRAFGVVERNSQDGKPDKYLAKLVEPLSAQAGQLGLDLGADPVTREAIQRAIDSAQAALSGTVILQQDENPESGFFYFVPVFSTPSVPASVAARRAALKFVFYAQMNTRYFYSQPSIQSAANHLAYFEIFDGASPSSGKLIYVSRDLPAARAQAAPGDSFAGSLHKKDKTMRIGGRTITLHSGSAIEFESATDSTFSKRIFVFTGAALSLLFSLIIWLLLTARDRAEARIRSVTTELRNSLNETRDLMQALNQNLSVSITDSAGNITFVNDLFCKITGFSREEWIGKNHRLIRSDVQPDAFWDAMWRTVSGGAVWRSEVCNRNKSGVLYWVDIVIVPIFNGDEIEKYVSIRIDIGAARAAQDALAQERKNLQNIIMGTGAGTWELDVQKNMFTCNERWAAMLGYTLEELQPLGMDTWARVCHPDDLGLSIQKMTDCFSGVTDTLDAQVRVMHKDQHVVWIRTLAKVSAWDANGKPVRLSGTNMDISTEKEYQASLENAMQVAQAATVAKSQFLANMSHELRTPMNAILGMLRLLKNTDLNRRQKDYALKSEGAAKSLLGLLNDILDVSKIDAGKMTLDLQPFRMDKLLRDLSVILSSGVKGKQVEVLFDIDTSLPPVLIGDEMRLKQILVNLGGNAIKFTSQGSVILQIRILARTDREATLKFAVIDTGIGIAAEHRERIFEGFSQAEASTTRRFGGTGLGLSICKQLVGLMGGELTLASTLGEGSTFHFTLALPLSRDVERDIESGPERSPTPLRVLAVDDNPLACDLMAAMAESWGWKLDKAFSGAEAIALVRQRQASGQPPYEAIFMDWYMPEMDGWETIARIKSMLSPQDMPLMLMVTAHGLENLGEISPQNHALLDGFLVKPLTASMLFDAVSDAKAARTDGQGDAGLSKNHGDSLKGLRILLVEDNPINQQVAQELLTAEGALVRVAENGKLAVDAVAAASPPFDAVLMDIHMPVMDGYAATRLIRQELGISTLPIIAMTANAMRSDREECLAAGMNDHIGKPFELSQLIAMLQQHTNFRAGSAASVMAAAVSEQNHLNENEALMRLGGNGGLYGRILQSYLSEISGMPDQLADLLEQQDMVQAKRLLHTIKGLSGTVGANRLAGLLAAAEDAFRQPDNHPSDQTLLAELRREVVAVSEMARLLIGKYAVAGRETTLLEFNDIKSRLKELQTLLQASDMRAMDVLEELRRSPGSTLRAQAEMAALFRAVESFDFSLAATCCQTILDQLDPVAENAH